MDFSDNTYRESRTLHLRVGDRQKNEFEIAGEFILPDSLADIKRILAISGELHPDEGRVESGKAVSAGEALFRLLFVTDGGEVRTATFSTAYENRQALTAPEGAPTATFLPRLTSVTARAVNPRKVGIRARVNAGTAGWEERNASPVYPDSVTDADRLTFEEKKDEVCAASFFYTSVSGIEAGDDIALPEGKPAIREILFSALTFTGVRAEARDTSVQVNADADLTFFYQPEGGDGKDAVFLRHRLPLSYLVEAPDCAEGDTVFALLTPGKVIATPAEGLDGLARLIETDFTYGITLVIGRKNLCPVVRDLYSTAYETETLPVEIDLTGILGKVDLTEKLKGQGKFKEEGTVLGVMPQVRPGSVTVNDAGHAVAGGDVLMQVILKEADGSVVAEPVSLPYAVDTGLGGGENAEYFVTAEVSDAAARLADGTIDVTAVLHLSVLGMENSREQVVGGVRITAETIGGSPSSFTVYYPAKNETLWEIAKKFRVPMSALSAEGGSDREGMRRALIIPKQKKPLYRGVVEG